MTEPADPLELSSELADRYSEIRKIGSGGMGDIYVGLDTRHDRKVAIKVLRSDSGSAIDSDRFLREISIAAKLSHPNIVPIYDSGKAGSLLYYVMPYVEGESLRERLESETQLSIEAALGITFGVADALAFAHSRGIIHRDIKPANILLDSNRAVVADFGIARTIDVAPGDTLTSAGLTIGTIAYMSPEQAGGDGRVDFRSDVYSLALVLYEMLAGDLPFHAATPEGMLARKAIGRYEPVSDARATVPPHIDRAIARALRPVPADRFATVSAFVDALRSPDPEPARRRRLPGRTLVTLGIAAAIVVVALVQLDPPNRLAEQEGIGRIVVAPFENRTGDPSLDVVGVMAGDWITEGLQRTGVLEVVPITSSVQAASYLHGNRSSPPGNRMRSFAHETGASTVVSGTLYRQADKLLFRVNVADSNGARLVGTITSIDAPYSDPVSGLEELRNRVMGWFAVQYDARLRSPGSGSERPPTYEAYSRFADGMTHYIAVDNAKAMPLFLDAYSRDTSFTVALLYASISASNLGALSRADSLLAVVNRRRSSLSDYNRAWLDYRAAFVRGDREAALAAIRIAARQAPQSKASYNHALEAFYARRFNEALAAIESIPPESGAMRGFAPYWEFYGTILHALGRYDDELKVGRRSHATYPDRLTSFRSLGRGFAATGKLDSLSRTMHLASTVPTDPSAWDYGHMLAEVAEELRAHGHRDAAEGYFSQLEGWLLRQKQPSQLRLIRVKYALGKFAEAGSAVAIARKADPTSVDYLGFTALVRARITRPEAGTIVKDSLEYAVRPYQFGLVSYYRARLASVAGDREGATEYLTRAISEGRSFDIGLHREIDFEPIRGFPPYERFMRSRD